MKYYKARWGVFLIVMSTLLTALCLVQAAAEFRRHGASTWVGWMLVVLVAGCALSSIRGYTITPDAILIHRPGWSTRVALAGLLSARRESQSMWRGIRIGNGGFFSFTGWRYSPRLGFYRVFATNAADRVVLRFSTRTVVVSPSTPDDFVRELTTAKL
jgi:Bacterial PH domain